MAGTRLLVQTYFVVALGAFITWAIWHERVPRGTFDEVLFNATKQRLEARLLESSPLASAYTLEFVAAELWEPLVVALKRAEPELDRLSAATGLDFVLRSRRVAQVFFDEDPGRTLRFLVSNASRLSFKAVHDGGLLDVDRDRLPAAVDAALDMLRSDLGVDDDALPLAAATANVKGALDSLAIFRDVQRFMRPSTAARDALILLNDAPDDLPGLTRAAVRARRIVDAALADPDLALPQHMPAEHLAAIYTPLVAPLLLPLFYSFVDEARRYRRLVRLKEGKA